MSENNVSPKMFKVNQNDLKCPICYNDRFYTDHAQLNTAVATFFNLDWTNKSATYFVCSECTHISWFLQTNNITVSNQ